MANVSKNEFLYQYGSNGWRRLNNLFSFWETSAGVNQIILRLNSIDVKYYSTCFSCRLNMCHKAYIRASMDKYHFSIYQYG